MSFGSGENISLVDKVLAVSRTKKFHVNRQMCEKMYSVWSDLQVVVRSKNSGEDSGEIIREQRIKFD